MNWLNEIDQELQRVRPGENPGRTRTIARRIAGIALMEMNKTNPLKNADTDFIKILRSALSDTALPADVLAAVERLQSRVDANFTSPSSQPIADAMVIVEFVKHSLQ